MGCHSCSAVLWCCVDMPVASNDMCLGFTVQITVEVPPLHVEVCWCSSSTMWTSLCSCRDVFCSPGQGRLHARCVQRQVLEVDSTENCGVSAVARRCLLVQFIDGCGRPCPHAETCFRPVVMQRQGFCSDSAEHCLEVYRCSSSSQR